MSDEPGNQTPNTPAVSETALRAMKMDELRQEAKDAGVDGASTMRKGELIHAVADAEQAAASGSGKAKGPKSAKKAKGSKRERDTKGSKDAKKSRSSDVRNADTKSKDAKPKSQDAKSKDAKSKADKKVAGKKKDGKRSDAGSKSQGAGGARTEEPGNQTPNTPDVSETALRAMKMDELRQEAKDAGVAGAGDLRKGELVHAVAETKQAAADSGSGDGSDHGKAASASDQGDATASTSSSATDEDELRSRTVGELRAAAKDAGVSGTSGMRKDDLVHAVAEARGARGDGDASGDQGDGDLGAGPDDGHVRLGPETSKSIKYSQEVTSTEEEPEREGRSLVTSHHQVIKEWAEARNATPATVPGTEHGDHLGVLRLDFGNDNDDLRHVSWEEWFATFDLRKLNFIYQHSRTDGHESTFFRLESPDREDG